jgi:tetratricopeptide (TPR) repeat protein
VTVPRFPAGLLLGFLLFGAAGCVAPGTERLVAQPGHLPLRSEAESVPFFPQDRYYCGPASLAMALAWGGLNVSADDLASQVYTPGRRGSFAADIVAAARRNGRIAIEIRTLDDLLTELAAGHPVIVFQNLSLPWIPQWHFAVAIGYDLPAREIVLRSGTERRLAISLDAFERTWERTGRWALLVLPPEKAPARADSDAWLRAAAGLEQASRIGEALVAYRAMREVQPENHLAGLGQANALLALGDFRGAEAAYREVLSADSTLAAAWNNLAYALHRQGRRTDAIVAAERAVFLGGREAAAYADTLREVSAEIGVQ